MTPAAEGATTDVVFEYFDRSSCVYRCLVLKQTKVRVESGSNTNKKEGGEGLLILSSFLVCPTLFSIVNVFLYLMY